MSQTRDKSYWTRIIRPEKKWFDLDLKELFHYRDLILLLAKRNFSLIYKQTILGPAWVLIQPLLTSAVLTAVFGVIAGLPTDGVPTFLFYLCGYIPWHYFAKCLTGCSKTFLENRDVFGKVYFPRMAVPLSTALYQLLDFAVQFAFFLLLLAGYLIFSDVPLAPDIGLILLSIPALLQLAVLGIGFGTLVSALTTRYRDLALLVDFGVTLWMYASPVAYSASVVSERMPQLEWLYMSNPISCVIQLFRCAYMGADTALLRYYPISAAVTVIAFAAGIMLFSHTEKTFMDTI